jgi:hypothetical protein
LIICDTDVMDSYEGVVHVREVSLPFSDTFPISFADFLTPMNLLSGVGPRVGLKIRSLVSPFFLLFFLWHVLASILG